MSSAPEGTCTVSQNVPSGLTVSIKWNAKYTISRFLITMLWLQWCHVCHDVLHHWHLDCLFKSLSYLMAKKQSKLALLALSWGDSNSELPSQKGGKRFSECNDVIILEILNPLPLHTPFGSKYLRFPLPLGGLQIKHWSCLLVSQNLHNLSFFVHLARKKVWNHENDTFKHFY